MSKFKVRFVLDYDELVEADTEEEAEEEVYNHVLEEGHIDCIIEKVEEENE